MNELSNVQKYENYKIQMSRLNRALNSEFYLEAIFIEHAVLEDRLESVLRHSGKWNPKPDSFVSIDAKIKKVRKLAEEKKGLAHKYFSNELLDSVFAWKESRNPLVHALMKKSVCTDELIKIATEGREIVRIVCNKAKSYNNALDKMSERGGKTKWQNS